MNKTTLNSQKEKHSMLSLRRATPRRRRCTAFRTYFYPRPPCGERLSRPCSNITRLSFLSTLSLQRATWLDLTRSALLCYFYPRSPCGERRRSRGFGCLGGGISIHALLAESDYRFRRDLFTAQALFLSTLSLRRATWCMSRKTPVQAAFLSTLSLRRATILSPLSNSATYISIHALLAESDGSFFFSLESQLTFLSTLSLRRATAYADETCGAIWDISIHALLAESDIGLPSSTPRPRPFLSTLSLRRATRHGCFPRADLHYFYPRSPCGERQY